MLTVKSIKILSNIFLLLLRRDKAIEDDVKLLPVYSDNGTILHINSKKET